MLRIPSCPLNPSPATAKLLCFSKLAHTYLRIFSLRVNILLRWETVSQAHLHYKPLLALVEDGCCAGEGSLIGDGVVSRQNQQPRTSGCIDGDLFSLESKVNIKTKTWRISVILCENASRGSFFLVLIFHHFTFQQKSYGRS